MGVETECYPLEVVPGLNRLFLDWVDGGEASTRWYGNTARGDGWMHGERPPLAPEHRERLAEVLFDQNHAVHAGPAAIANIDRLRHGARAVVTGQQVGLFGGPLLTLMKAASAVRLAAEATQATGVDHVPLFWLASEDHDFAEADHVVLSARHELRMVRLGHAEAASGAPVGSLRLGPKVEQALDEAAAVLGEGSEAMELLRRCYRPEATFAHAFGQWMATIFREQGLIVLDASGRACHQLGGAVLRAAIERAAELEDALRERGADLEQAGYAQQVKIAGSLLFLLEGAPGCVRARVPLKREANGEWAAGTRRYVTAELLRICEEEPERLSPNALLRPVLQDALLPTAAYVGGPAEVAYWAQASVLYQRLLGRITPVLPRLSATLVDSRTRGYLAGFELSVPEVWAAREGELRVKMGARAMPAEGKKRLQAAGQALASELDELTGWMRELDAGLGRSADVAASKMRYQMNRLRGMAARFELERDESIARRVDAIEHAVFPDRHQQERLVGAAWGVARFGQGLAGQLVEAAGGPCPGHKILYL